MHISCINSQRCRICVRLVRTYIELLLSSHFEIWYTLTYMKFYFCKYAGQEFCKCYGAIIYKAFCNFEHINFLNHFKINKANKDFKHLFQNTSVQDSPTELLLQKGVLKIHSKLYRKKSSPKCDFNSWDNTFAWLFS